MPTADNSLYATVSTTEQSRLHSCWRMGITFSRSWSTWLRSREYCMNIAFGISCRISCTKAGDFLLANLRDLKEAIKNKWKEVTIETVQKSIAQWKNDWMQLESRMEARFNTFSANRCDWISISWSEKCWNYWLFCTFRTLFCVFQFYCWAV